MMYKKKDRVEKSMRSFGFVGEAFAKGLAGRKSTRADKLAARYDFEVKFRLLPFLLL